MPISATTNYQNHKAMVNIIGPVVLDTRDHSSQVRGMAKAYGLLLEVTLTKANTLMTRSVVKAYTAGKMAANTLASSRMTYAMVTVRWCILMVVFRKDHGWMESNVEKSQ